MLATIYPVIWLGHVGICLVAPRVPSSGFILHGPATACSTPQKAICQILGQSVKSVKQQQDGADTDNSSQN